MRPIDAEPSEGRVKLHSAIRGDGAYEAFKRIASEFYTNHTYKFVALTLDGDPRPDIVTFAAEFWRVPDGAESPPPNDPLTLEQLREMDGEPVWCVVYNLPKEGYYCLCDKGTIMTPSGSLYDCGDIKDWTFYRHKPEDKARSASQKQSEPPQNGLAGIS